MYPTKEKSRATHLVSTATAAPDSGKQIPFFSAELLPGESQAETTSRIDFLDNAAEAVILFKSCDSPFFKREKLLDETQADCKKRQQFLHSALQACLDAGSGNFLQQIELYVKFKYAGLQVDELDTEGEEVQLDLLPFFSPTPLPDETKEKTKQRLQFINDAIQAIAGTANRISTGVQQQLLLYVKQNNLFEEARTFWGRKDLETTLWEMFEALVRDEITAEAWETRSTACFIYKWLREITDAIYPMQEAA